MLEIQWLQHTLRGNSRTKIGQECGGSCMALVTLGFLAFESQYKFNLIQCDLAAEDREQESVTLQPFWQKSKILATFT